MSFPYIKNTELWCDRCDARKIHSDQPETGEFMSQEGHIWDFIKEDLAKTYTTVIWAVCTKCLKEE